MPKEEISISTMPALKRSEFWFLFLVVASGIAFRLIPRLALDPHLLTFQADIWYRLCLAQYLIDHGQLPSADIRYLAYGPVPLWYNPLALYFFAVLHTITHLDLPTICSRVMPVIESFSILPTYFLCRALYHQRVAAIATAFLSLSPSYLFWTGISTLQSFTVFLLPITILLWVRFLQGQFLLDRRWVHLGVLGGILALNFLTHLSFFTHVIILFFVQTALVIERKARLRDSLYLLIPVLISQLLTAFWWLPRNLYWWWAMALAPSSNLIREWNFLMEYGLTSAIVGLPSLAGLLTWIWHYRKSVPAFYLIPVFWALFPLLESHNQYLLTLGHHGEWTWNNLCKPLEGYRFYLFLAQPLAIAFALVTDQLLAWPALKHFRFRPATLSLAAIILGGILLCDTLFIYQLPKRLAVSGVKMPDIKAAQWFREHSRPGDRILAEYYTAQMFSGICGGKALLGSMLPLKNVPFPYITDRHRVLYDIYSVYADGDVGRIAEVLTRYGCTHIYISDRNIGYLEYLMQNLDGPRAARPVINKRQLERTFSDRTHCKIIYQDGDVKIVEWLDPGPAGAQSELKRQ